MGGAPASGKTTLASILARDLALPLLTKDLIKETLFDTLGTGGREWSRGLSRASYAVLNAVTLRLVEAGMSTIIESNFHRGRSERELRPLLDRARTVQIHCQTSAEILLRRYDERVEKKVDRHPGHDDAAVVPDIGAWFETGIYEPLDLGVPTLRVDTTNGYQPGVDAIRAFVEDDVGRATRPLPTTTDVGTL